MDTKENNHKVKNSFLIGIAGGSGSGKTTFIKALRERFTDSELCIVYQDNYYKEREKQLLDENDYRNFDLPESILNREMVRDLNLLTEGTVVKRKEYVFNNEKAKSKTLTFQPAPIIIVEGLFVFHNEELMNKFDLTIFIQAKENLKVIRRIKRDQLERNYPLEDVLYRYERHVLPAYEKYIEPYKYNADLIVNNNDNFDAALNVVVGFMECKINSLNNNKV